MADISSTFGALSSTESSSNNGPSGTTVIGAGLDDNIRLGMAHIAAWRDQIGWGGVTLTSVAGTNTITATVATAGSVTFGPTALAANQRYILTPANTNTGAATLNITSPNGGSALGAKNIFCGGAALVGGELVAGVPIEVIYDGTQFNAPNVFAKTTTWVPVLTFATAGDLSVSYSTQSGRYTKNGKIVTASCIIVTSAFTHSSASGNLQVTGLPYAATTASGHKWTGVCTISGYTKANYTQVNASIASAAQLVLFDVMGSAQGVTTLQNGDMPTGGTVVAQFTISYEVST